MNMTRKLLGMLALAVGVLFLTDVAVAQENLVDTIKKRGKLQVGFGSFLPWAIRDKQGNWVGFEIDVSTKLAKDMGVGLELIPTALDGIIPSLIAGKFDVIIGGLSVTPARKEQADFSEPYWESGQGSPRRSSSPGLKYPEGYNDAKVTSCAGAARRSQDDRGEVAEGDDSAVRDDAIAFQEVINGNAHAVLSSEPKPTFFTLQNPEGCSSRRTITSRLGGRVCAAQGQSRGDCVFQ